MGREGDRGRAAEIVELAGLARGLEAGGIYNGAKLVRALLDRELIRAGLAAVPADEAATRDGVARLADRLAAAGEDEALVAALRAAAVAAGEGTTLLLADAPRAWTCRSCGRISLSVAPGTCPDCEAPGPMAREQAPVWYFEPMTPAAALEELAAGSVALAAIVEGRDDDDLARPPRPGEWSVREALQHLVSAEELLATRIPRMLDEDDPELVAAAAWVLPASDEATAESELGASALLTCHAAMRAETLARLRAIAPEGWLRTGRHPEWGTVTVLGQAGYFARHLWSHLAQVRAAVEGRVPGQRLPGERPPVG